MANGSLEKVGVGVVDGVMEGVEGIEGERNIFILNVEEEVVC